MSAVAIVLIVAVVAAVVVGVWSRTTRRSDPVDPVAEERWLLSWFRRHPRIGAVAGRIDRNVAGGVMLVVTFAVVLLTAVLVGWLFETIDTNRGLARWDRSAAEWGSEHATSRSTWVLDHVTDLGGTVYLVAIVVVVALLDWRRRRNEAVLLFLGVTLGGIFLLNNALKLLVDRERPDVVHLVGSAGSSFPSGHSAAAAATWCALALVVSRHWSGRGRALAAAGAAAIAIAVATSRVLLGVHWLTDVVAGLLVGWCWFILCALAFGGRVQRLGQPAEEATQPELNGPVTASPR